METRLYLYKNYRQLGDSNDWNEVYDPLVINGEHLFISNYTVDTMFMGGASTITAQIKHSQELDNVLKNVYILWEKEIFKLNFISSSKYNNETPFYIHDVRFVSLHSILANVYLTDESVDDDVLMQNGTTRFSFYGTLKEFAVKINKSLKASGLSEYEIEGLTSVAGYKVEVDENIETEPKSISFEDTYILNALQRLYEEFEIPYRFEGGGYKTTIRFAPIANIIDERFEYGVDNPLVSISKNYEDTKRVNKVTGYGSSKNIEYYYPNPTSRGFIEAKTYGEFYVKTDDPILFNEKIRMDSKIVYSGQNGVVFNGGFITPLDFSFVSGKSKIGEYTLEGGFLKRNLTIEDRSHFSILWFDANNNLIASTYGDKSISSENNGVAIGEIKTICDPQEQYKAFYNNYDIIKPRYNTTNAPAINYTGSINYRYEFNYKLSKNKTKYFSYKFTITSYDKIGNGEHSAYIRVYQGENKVIYEKKGADAYHDKSSIVQFDYNFFLDDSTSEDIRVVVVASGAQGNKAATSEIFVSCQVTPNMDDKLWYDETKKVSYKELSEIGLSLSGGTYEIGDYIVPNVYKYISPTSNLVPPIFRDTNGEELFYFAKDYPFEKTGDYVVNEKIGEYIGNDGLVHNDYIESNVGSNEIQYPYTEGNAVEHIFSYEDIYPTIKGGTYALDGETYEIDKFVDFGYDSNDNDEFVGEEAEHSYFFAKLNPLGFNLFSHASANGEMEVSFTSGHLAGCVCKIVVDENSQKNVVKIDSNGNLVQENGKVAFWNSIPSKENNEAEYNLYLKQNDTTNNSVWVALMKDNSTYGVLMPSVNANIKPAVGDSFVLTNIVMPTKYLEDAEKRLEKAIMADLLLNNSETFSFSIVFSDLYWTREKLETILPKLLAFNRILLSYNNEEYSYYIKSINIKVNSDTILPKVTIDISDTMAIQTGALNNIVSALDKKFVTVIANNTAQIVKTQEEYQNALDTAISTVGDTIRMYKDVEAVQNMNVDFDLGVGGTVVSQMASARRSNIDEELQLGNYVEGSAGASLLKRPDGSTYMEVDRLKVRMKAIFEELEVQKVNTIGGSLIMSPAGSLTCTRVATRSELISDYGYLEPEYPTNDQETLASIEKSFSSLNFYRCFFKNEEDDVTITNYFQVGDLAYCKTFNTGNNENRFYWRQVVSVGRDYIDLAVDICASDSDIPLVGDVICHLGNKGFEAISTGFTVEQDPYRQSAIMMSSVDEFSPSITLYQGINEFSYADKAVIQYGAIKWLENGESVAKAFFNVYGDMYIGDKPKEDGSESYMRYDTKDGLIVKGKLIVQGKGNVEELIANATPKDYDEFKSAVEKAQEDIEGLQKQIDGAIETWFYEGVPTLDNAPAKDWTTEEIKNVHLGDLYYDGETGKAYRFQMSESDYVWNLITDTDIQAALDAANKAQDTADNKRRIFVEQPTPPYDKGDLWSQGNDKPLKICITARTTGSFVKEDWDFADNLNDVAEDAKKALENTQTLSEELSTLSGVVDVFKEDVNGAFRDGIITEEEKSRINGYSKQIEGVYNDVNASYIQVINSEFLENTPELVALTTAIEDFNSAVSDLLSFIGDINSFVGEKEKFTELVIDFNTAYDNFNSYYASVSSAIFAANNKINSVLSAKIEDSYKKITDDYSYLTNALNGKTITDGGLVLTSMIALGVFSGEGNGTFTTKSGINGTYGSTQQDSDTIAFWAGGEMKDLFKYNKDENGNWIVTEGDNPADFLVRMDGTGYAAGGRFSWDKDGKITADPLSFFVGEDSVGKLLASFQIFDAENGDWYLTPQKYFDGLTVKGKPLFAEEAKMSKLTIGNAVFVWDDTNSILRVEHQQSGKVAHFLASGAVATRGLGEIESGGGGTGTGVDLLNVPSDIIPIIGGSYSLGSSKNAWKTIYANNGAIGSLGIYEGGVISNGYMMSINSSWVINPDGSATFSSLTINGASAATQNWVNSQSFAKISDLSAYVNAEGGTINNATLTGDVTGNGWSIEGGIANFGEVNTDSLYVNGEGVLTSNSLANYVTLNSAQTISGMKTFTGGITASHLYSVEYLDSSALTINAEEVNFTYYGDDSNILVGLINGYKPLTLGNTSFSPALTSGTVIGTITIGGESKTIYAPSSSNVDLSNYVTLDSEQNITGSKYFSGQITSTVADGTAPFVVASKTLVSNLNADMLDGKHLSDILASDITGNAATATYAQGSKNTGYIWHCTIQVGEWCRIMNMSTIHPALLQITFSGASQQSCYTFLIGSGHSSNGFISQIGATGYSANSSQKIRITRSPSVATIHYIEVYNPSVATTVRCRIIPLGSNSSAGWNDEYVYYTEYTPTTEDAIECASIECHYDGIVAKKFYGNIKLSTPRTLWGQSFDGSGNVSGNLTDVKNITGTAGISINTTGTNGILLRYNSNDATSVALYSTAFRPFDAANGVFDLGSTSARWKGIYGTNADFTGSVTTQSIIGVSSKTLVISSTNGDLALQRNNNYATSVVLNGSAFKPYDRANLNLDLGSTSARWKGIYGQSLDLSSDANIGQHVYATGALLSGGKRTSTDGLAGAILGSTGYLTLTSASTPYVDFYFGNTTTNPTRIKETAKGTLTFSAETNIGSTLSTNPLKIQFDLSDATAKFYSLVNSGNKTVGSEMVALQTCFDGTDPESSSYVTRFEDRCNLLLQPRGGQVYVGYTPTTLQLTYALNVGSKLRLYGDRSDSPEVNFYRDGLSSWKIMNKDGNLIFQNNYTTVVQDSYFDVLKLNYNTGNATLKGSLYGGSAIYSNGKTGMADGKAGFYAGSEYIGITGATPVINFHYGNSTSSTSAIKEVTSGTLGLGISRYNIEAYAFGKKLNIYGDALSTDDPLQTALNISTAYGDFTNVGIGIRIGQVSNEARAAKIYYISESTYANHGGIAFYNNEDPTTCSEKLRLTNNGNLIPKYNTSTQSLGSSNARWVAYLNSVDVSGNATIGGETVATQVWVNSQSFAKISDLLSIPSDIIPNVGGTYNLGSSAKAWKTIYASSGAIGSLGLYESGVISNGYIKSINNSWLINLDGSASFSSLTINGASAATQSWVNSQGFAKISDLSAYVNAEGGTINNATLTGDVTGNGWSIEGGIANFGEVNTDSLYVNGEGVLTSNSLANYVTLNTEQTISERKTFSKGIIGGLHSIEAPNSVFIGLDSTVHVYGGLTIGTGDLTTPSIQSDNVLPKSNSSGSIGSSSSKWRNGYINNLYSDVIYADTLTSSTSPYLNVTAASLDLMSCELYGYDSDGNANWNIASNGIASLNSVVISSNDYVHNINGNADGELVIWPSEYLVIENDTITDYAITCSKLVQTSDIRYKNILSNVHLKLSDIAAAPTFKFSWTNETDGSTHIGTSAQYWQEIAGELVVENKKTGKLGLDYSTAALVSAVSIAREVNTMKMWQTTTTDIIEELKEKVKKLEEENKELRELLNNNN